jgi:hypothetical protein
MFNIFTLAFVAIVIGIVLAVFATRQKIPNSPSLVPPEEDYDRDPTGRPLALTDLFTVGEKLMEENQLSLKDKLEIAPNEVYWITESKNEFFFGSYVLGFFQTTENEKFVSLPTLFEFKDFIKSVQSAKGFYFTTGYFTRDVHQPLEGPKVSLYNRLKILSEMKRFNIPV